MRVQEEVTVSEGESENEVEDGSESVDEIR